MDNVGATHPDSPELDKFSFDSQLILEEIRAKQEQFALERNWEQYHTPRNLLLAMVGEVGELAELFQWRGEVKKGLPGWKIEDKVHLGEELSDVLIYLVRLSDRCHVNLPAAVIRKFELNTQRYPTGKDSGVIGIAKMGQEETWSDSSGQKVQFQFPSQLGRNSYEAGNVFIRDELEAGRHSKESSTGYSNLFWFQRLESFLKYCWAEEDKVHLGEKLTSVLVLLIRLSDRCHVNLPAAVLRKFELNAQKYPADKAYGSSSKYTAYCASEEKKAKRV